MIELRFEVDESVIDRLTAKLELELSKAVRTITFEIQRRAQGKVPVDTGALKASIYTSVGGKSTYGTSLAQALSKRPGATPLMAVGPRQPLEGVVGVGVEYGIFIEYGAFFDRDSAEDREGRIGETDNKGGFVTYEPGYYFMHDAAASMRSTFKTAVLKAIRNARS